MRTTATPISKGNSYGYFNVLLGTVSMVIALWMITETGLLFEIEKYLHQWNWWKGEVANSTIPRWLLFFVSLMFLTTGLTLGLRGLNEINLKNLRRRHFRQNPDSPWLWDYKWSTESAPGRNHKQWGSKSSGFLILIVFHILAWSIAARENFDGMAIIFPIAISLFTVLLIVVSVVLIRREQFHRGVKIHLSEFPLRLGSSISLRLEGLKTHPLTELEVELRAVREYYLTSEIGVNVECQIAHHQAQLFDDIDQDNYVVSFVLPDDHALATRISQRPATFWELHLYAKADGANLDKCFLLPIY